ncbi:MAG: hypothetical protein ACKO3P_15990, partial [Planctomycetaceae bacterium]
EPIGPQPAGPVDTGSAESRAGESGAGEIAEEKDVAAGAARGEGRERRSNTLVCLDGGGNAAPRVRWTWEAPGAIRRRVAIGPRRVALLTSREGGADAVVVLERESGVVRATAVVPRPQAIPLLADREGVYGADAWGVWHRDWDLVERWRGVDLGELQSLATWGDLLLAVSDSPPRLVALDRRLGETVWRVELDERVASRPGEPPVVVGDEIWLRHATGVRAYSLFSGGELWQADWPAAGAGEAHVTAWTGRALWWRDAAGGMWELSAGGERAWSRASWGEAGAGVGPLVALAPGGTKPGGFAWRSGGDWWGWWDAPAVKTAVNAEDKRPGETGGNVAGEGSGRGGDDAGRQRRVPFRMGRATGEWPPVGTREGVLWWRAEGLIELRPEEPRP